MAEWNQAALRLTLQERLSPDELRSAAFDLGLRDVDDHTKAALARALILHLNHRQTLDHLGDWLRKHRPDIDLAPLVGDGDSETRPDGNWWDALSPRVTPRVRGDVIIAEVGAGAQGVAIGKNITQTLTGLLGPATTDDPTAIRQGLDSLRTVLSSGNSKLMPVVLSMAEFQLDLLAGELAARGDAPPSANAITRAGDWLLANVTALTPHLRSFFALPAVGRALARAGDHAVTWAAQRFAEPKGG